MATNLDINNPCIRVGQPADGRGTAGPLDETLSRGHSPQVLAIYNLLLIYYTSDQTCQQRLTLFCLNELGVECQNSRSLYDLFELILPL
jgi:hypothetical protein